MRVASAQPGSIRCMAEAPGGQAGGSGRVTALGQRRMSTLQSHEAQALNLVTGNEDVGARTHPVLLPSYLHDPQSKDKYPCYVDKLDILRFTQTIPC